MTHELSIAALILVAVLAAKCERADAQPPKPPCVKRSAVMQTTDADGAETVTVLPYFECETGRPADRTFKPMCHADGDNPYAPTLYVQPRDLRELEWLCAQGGEL